MNWFFKDIDIKKQLHLLKYVKGREGEKVISEANRILNRDLFEGKKVLAYLPQYHKSFEKLDEDQVDEYLTFSTSEIREVAIDYRLKFLDMDLFKPKIPEKVFLEINTLNKTYGKDLKYFKVLADPICFTSEYCKSESFFFVCTNSDSYYLIHSFGKPLKKIRKFQFLPMRSFEFLVVTILLITLIIAVSLPTRLITLDHKATYWSGYRAAAFFHLLIFNFGVTAYFTFAFAKNFSSSVWNRYKDF